MSNSSVEPIPKTDISTCADKVLSAQITTTFLPIPSIDNEKVERE